MAVNADKEDRWPRDSEASVDLYNEWYERFAPEAFRETREKTRQKVIRAFNRTENFTNITGEFIRDHPKLLSVFRMATAPPIAVDRLAGLTGVSNYIVKKLEQGKKPKSADVQSLDLLAQKVMHLLDRDLFSWLDTGGEPSDEDRARASAVVADRLCGSVADPIIRNAQEERQLGKLKAWLEARGYTEQRHPPAEALDTMPTGTYAFRMTVIAGPEGQDVRIPVDGVIQPHKLRPSGLPILLEAKSAGDFTNTNKRWKEEATKMRNLRERFGDEVEYVLFLCGYFGTPYLKKEADAGLDWVWEHRIDDLAEFGV